MLMIEGMQDTHKSVSVNDSTRPAQVKVTESVHL